MADYICKHCKRNNNGWCVKRKRNKLSETLDCSDFERGKYGEFEDNKESSISENMANAQALQHAWDTIHNCSYKNHSDGTCRIKTECHEYSCPFTKF